MRRGILVSLPRGLTPGCLALAHTLPSPELEGVALFETLVMAAVGAETRQGEVHSAVELELGFNDPEGFGALFVALPLVRAFYDFANDIVFNISDVVGELVCFDVCLVIAWFWVFPVVALV